MSTEQNKQQVTAFIERVWNQQDFSVLDELLDPQYRDHSFLPQVPPTRDGLLRWVQAVSSSFTHCTVIESIVAEGDQVAVRIRFEVTHTGPWRALEPTGRSVAVKGFRFFTLRNGKILSHQALIDGETLHNELSSTYSGCTISADA